MVLHLHQLLCLKLSNAVVVVKSSAGQKGVDADTLTLHVQCFVHVREATGVSMRRQGRLYRLMKMTMIDEVNDILIWHFANNPCNEKHNKSLIPYTNLTNIMHYWPMDCI